MSHSFTLAEARSLYQAAEAKHIDNLLADMGKSIEYYIREAIERRAKVASVDLLADLEGKVDDIRKMFPEFEIKVRPRHTFDIEDEYYDPQDRDCGGQFLSISGWAD